MKHKTFGLVIIGLAMGWGRVQAHEDGWRCEYATPLAFTFSGKDRLLANGMKNLMLRFDVPLMKEEELENWYLANTVK